MTGTEGGRLSVWSRLLVEENTEPEEGASSCAAMSLCKKLLPPNAFR